MLCLESSINSLEKVNKMFCEQMLINEMFKVLVQSSAALNNFHISPDRVYSIAMLTRYKAQVGGLLFPLHSPILGTRDIF